MSGSDHSGGEISVEASVAGEAAAAAVEEVQSREEVAEQASGAAMIAMSAEATAVDATDRAAAAQDTAVVATEIAADASDSAAQAQEQTQAVAALTVEMFEAYRAETDEKLRAMRDDISSRIPLPDPQPAFEEVDADVRTNVSNTGQSGTGESGSDGTGTGQAGEPPQARRGLRHRSR